MHIINLYELCLYHTTLANRFYLIAFPLIVPRMKKIDNYKKNFNETVLNIKDPRDVSRNIFTTMKLYEREKI